MAKRDTTKATKPAKTRSKSSVEDSVSEDYVSDSASDDEDVKSIHSDALDEEESPDTRKKRQRVASSAKRAQNSKHEHAARTDSRSKRGVSGKGTPVKKKRKVDEATANDEHDSDVELKEGQEVVGKVVEAPTTGWAPEGQISQRMLDFLMHLQDPACNDRPVYRRCEKEFKNFIEAFTTTLIEVDPQIPPLPPKDVIYRIYRDVRFSNDKTPYKTGFSAGFSRSGRKGIFAFCAFLCVVALAVRLTFKPGDESLLAAGAWCPAKNELNMIRNHIKRSSDRLRQIISEPEFVAHFGKPHPHPKGERQNIFGAEDELKTAPKGVDKNHTDIDLLKCRTLVVSRRFTDDQVLMGTFMQELEKVARILRPFVHCLNDMMTVPVDSDASDDDAHE
ncbi:hypothetical protein L210DRAFT_3610911 [Boletus edulis BED1]|uniref:Uncharacterized protein n=1 Tax=Boletus edulis BED1 TaxID=1328754 RepID=A0AAD4C0H5_BOLED|nr:hypothetical protein L210DRAFT_3610911 [Boletus edulis BED1]